LRRGRDDVIKAERRKGKSCSKLWKRNTYLAEESFVNSDTCKYYSV
jgi:hypothetical protein